MQMGWSTHGICCAWMWYQPVEHIRFMILESSSAHCAGLEKSSGGGSNSGALPKVLDFKGCVTVHSWFLHIIHSIAQLKMLQCDSDLCRLSCQ